MSLPEPTHQEILIGTRASPLAMWQAEYVAKLLAQAGMPSRLLPFETKGDKILNVSLSKIGSKGVFTEELETALLSGATHLAVHSAKDMPSRLPPGLELIAFCEREYAGDVVVSFDPTFKLGAMPGQRVGTASTRRRALLARYYPDLITSDVRGNLQTRFRKLGEGQYDALILASAGVERMGLGAQVVERLPIGQFVPPVGQGCVTVEAGVGLSPTLRQAIRTALNHPNTEACVLAERAYLAAMDGGCSIPTFGHAWLVDDKMMMEAGIVSLDGKTLVHEQASLELPVDITSSTALGTNLAASVLAKGGQQILKDIRSGQKA